MTKPLQRIAAALAVYAFMALVVWLGGYNFDTRGFWLAWWFIASSFFASFLVFGPFWEEKR